MKIQPEQLTSTLTSSLAPVYLVVGEDLLLVEESCRDIRETAKKNQYEERHAFNIETGFNWGTFFETANSLSLFSSRILIELQFKNSPNSHALQALSQYLSSPPSNNILLIIIPKLEKATAQHACIKAIEAIGVSLRIWPIPPSQMPFWIQARLKKLGLSASQEAIQFIADQNEGNLIAANQEIEKLSLIYNSSVCLSLENVMQAIYDNARYDVFNLADTILRGDARQGLRILHALQDEGVEPILILWSLARDIRLLLCLSEEILYTSPETLFAKHRIWAKRQPLVKAALKKHNKKTLGYLLRRAATIDQIIKSNQSRTVWRALSSLVVCMANPGFLSYV